MHLKLSAKQWVGLGLVLITQSAPVVRSQNIAFASTAASQRASVRQEMKLKSVLLDLQKHYGVEIVFEDRLVGAINVSANQLDFKDSIEKNLDLILKQNGLKYKRTRKSTFVIVEDRDKAAPATKEAKEESKESSEASNTVGLKETLASAINAPVVIDKTVGGKVADETGSGLPGVSVVVKGTQRGTSTNEEGKFSLSVPDGTVTLVFSFVGYVSQEVAVGNSSNLNVSLKADTKGLEEVVVVGYGTIRKSDLTGSVGVVKAETLQERPVSSLNQALSGKITGVNVSSNSGRPGGRANIRIRGNTSVSVNNNPLYVIDGVILNTTGLQNGSTPMDYINPNDIASVEVLKDASATAIYGARGANGVILVTTKRGSTDGGRINYDTDFSVGTLPRKLDLLNSKEFLAVEDVAYKNAQKFDPVGWAANKYSDPKLKRTNPLLFDAQGNPLYDTDWQDEAFQKAFTQNHQLSMTGGTEKGTYGAFLNYRNEDGLVKESWQKRYAGRFVFDGQLKDWIKVGGSLGYNDQTERQVDPLGNGGIVAMRQVLEAIPIIPVKFPDGKWAGNENYPGMEGGGNPIQIVTERSYMLKTQTMLGNLYANVKLAPGLEFRTTLGVNIINQRVDLYQGRDLNFISRSQRGTAEVNNNRYNSWQFENYLTYNKQFKGIHSINALVGLSWQHADRFEAVARAQGFDDDYFGVNNLGSGATLTAASSFANGYGLNSYFGRVNYGLKDKYLVTFTGRVDGSSKFGEANQYAFFPSAAAAWRVSEEEFLKATPVISNLKLRASYGVTGNSEIDPYRALARMGNYSVIFGGSRAIGIGISQLPNRDLRWEKTHQFDAGLELGLWDNRLTLELDVYRKKTTDMLLDSPVPSTSGYTNAFRNIGSMENKGLELGISTVNIRAEDFGWNTTFNISFNKNKVLSLVGNTPIYSGATIITKGQPVGSFFGRVNLGIYGNTAEEIALAAKYGVESGDVKYQDTNNDGKINDADRVIIGKGIPDGFGTFLNTIRYKNIELTADLQFMYGNDVLNRSIHSLEDRQGIANSFKSVLNAWTPENQNTPIAQLRPIAAGYDTQNDSHKVQDGSFIRGRNLLLAYNFPTAMVSRMKLNKLRVYASVQNFFVLTKYDGYDPEVSNSGSPFDQGFALYDYPRPRVFMLGLNVGL